MLCVVCLHWFSAITWSTRGLICFCYPLPRAARSSWGLDVNPVSCWMSVLSIFLPPFLRSCPHLCGTAALRGGRCCFYLTVSAASVSGKYLRVLTGVREHRVESHNNRVGNEEHELQSRHSVWTLECRFEKLIMFPDIHDRLSDTLQKSRGLRTVSF